VPNRMGVVAEWGRKKKKRAVGNVPVRGECQSAQLGGHDREVLRFYVSVAQYVPLIQGGAPTGRRGEAEKAFCSGGLVISMGLLSSVAWRTLERIEKREREREACETETC